MARRTHLFATHFSMGRLALYLCLAALLAAGLGVPARADGPAFMVKDINTIAVQNRSAGISFALTVGGDMLYFPASNGKQLWKSDGTASGTKLVREFGQYISFYDRVFVNGVLFFIAANRENDTELWRSDGTAAGTTLIKLFVGRPAGQLTNVNGTLFFGADGADGAGAELWRSDGTRAGTVRVADINPGTGNSSPHSLANMNGTLFFSATDSAGAELWKSDGTAAGTVRVRDINPGTVGSDPFNLQPVGAALFFAANDGRSGYELWTSDGTAAGTRRVKDINPGAANGFASNVVIQMQGALFFVANDGRSGNELWRSDGTAVGTRRVKDIQPFYTPITLTVYSVANLTNLNGTLFFSAGAAFFTNDGGFNLWKSNGTEAGTVPVINSELDAAIRDGLAGLTTFHDLLFFTTQYSELWRSDGSTAGTAPVLFAKPATAPSAPGELVDVGGTLLFVADDGRTGQELWRSDGTAAGTTQVKDIAAGTGSSEPHELTNVGGTLFFVATDGTYGELWKSDGTPAGTVKVKATNGSQPPFSPHDLTEVNGRLFFIAIDDIGTDIWTSDGTTAGTVPVTAINNALDDTPSNLTNVNGTLFFSVGVALFSGGGYNLWKSDGTTAGTTQLKVFDLPPRICTRIGCFYPSNIRNLTKVGNRLFFSAYDDATGFELWVSDGTAAGTVPVKDIYPGVFPSNPDMLTDVSGTLFFSAYEPGGGRELWKSNGTVAGTARVLDLAPGPESSSPSALAGQGGKLLFAASDGVHGSELWQSDGTAAGTTLAQDIVPGPAGANPAGLAFAGSRLFFSADDGHTGQELWAVSTGQDAYLQAPARTGAAPGGVAAISVHYGYHGLVNATTRVLTATLDPALTYLGDTSSITPTVSGQTLTWRLPDGAPGEDAWTLRVRVPTAAYGTRYPVTLTLTVSADAYPPDNTARIEVMIARQVFLPVIQQ